MVKHNWTKSPTMPYFYKTGIFRIQKYLIFIIICFVIIFLYTCPAIYNSICFHPLNSCKTFCHSHIYNSTYPLTKPITTVNSVSYKIAIISDLDTRSKSQNKNSWYSIMKTGYLSWVPASNELFVIWDQQDTILSSAMSLKGRGMEFSELVTFDGRLLTFDDRTGIVYSIEDGKIYPWVILMDGNGKSVKGKKRLSYTYKKRLVERRKFL